MLTIRRPAVIGVALALLLVVGMGTGRYPSERAEATVEIPRPAHTVVVILENENADSVIANEQAPYLNALAAQGATMTQSYGVTHPSQPNYLALFSGSTQGVTDDHCPVNLPKRASLGSQLRATGRSFVGYSESMPSAGYTGCAAGPKGLEYRRKHNPWVDFPDLPASVNQPFSAFPRDFNRLPDVSFVVPNMCNDMHDCTVRTGDTWMRKNLDAYAQWAKTHNSLLVVTFDEDGGSKTNKIPTLIVGERVRPGPSSEPMTHYTLLRTLEAAYGLPGLGRAAAVEPLTSIWTSSPRTPKPAGVVNGSFEHGLSGWTTTGSTGSSRTSRHGGSLNARAGGVPGDSVIAQTIVVPAGKTSLSMYWFGRCYDTKSLAWATIQIVHNTSGTTSTPLARTCVSTNTTWHKVTQKVAPGHSYTVRLISHDDTKKTTPNNTYFDDVSLS